MKPEGEEEKENIQQESRTNKRSLTKRETLNTRSLQ